MSEHISRELQELFKQARVVAGRKIGLKPSYAGAAKAASSKMAIKQSSNTSPKGSNMSLGEAAVSGDAAPGHEEPQEGQPRRSKRLTVRKALIGEGMPHAHSCSSLPMLPYLATANKKLDSMLQR